MTLAQLITLITLLFGVNGAPINTATFWLDANCSIPYENDAIFDTLPLLNSSQVLTRLNETRVPCIKKPNGYGAYRCQQSPAYTLIDLIEWDIDGVSECQTMSLPLNPTLHFYASVSSSPMACIKGWNFENQSTSSVLYARFNCSDEPEDSRFDEAENNLLQHRLNALQPNISAPIHYMKVFTDSSCQNEFENDLSYLYVADLSQNDIVMPDSVHELHDWFSVNQSFQLKCNTLPMPYRRSVEVLAFQGNQAEYGSRANTDMSVMYIRQWLNEVILFDTNFTAICPDGQANITYTFVDTIIEPDACHQGTFMMNGTSTLVWAQFGMANTASSSGRSSIWSLVVICVFGFSLFT